MLKTLIAQQAHEISSQQSELKRQGREIANRLEEIQHLKDLLRLARHRAFAPSSERHAEQLLLFNEAEDQAAKGPTEEDGNDKVAISYTRNRRPKRAPIPGYIPREEICVGNNIKARIM
jgi:hypothetical protein